MVESADTESLIWRASYMEDLSISRFWYPRQVWFDTFEVKRVGKRIRKEESETLRKNLRKF